MLASSQIFIDYAGTASNLFIIDVNCMYEGLFYSKKIILKTITSATIKKELPQLPQNISKSIQIKKKHTKADLVYYSFTFRLLFDIEKGKIRCCPKFDGPFTKTVVSILSMVLFLFHLRSHQRTSHTTGHPWVNPIPFLYVGTSLCGPQYVQCKASEQSHLLRSPKKNYFTNLQIMLIQKF